VQKLRLHTCGHSPRLQLFVGPVASLHSECSQDYQPNAEYRRCDVFVSITARDCSIVA
jgi:hypothetical protein